MNPAGPASTDDAAPPVQRRVGGWRGARSEFSRASLRNHLVAVILLSTVPLAILLSYQIFEGLRAQQDRLTDNLEREAAGLARGIQTSLENSAEALGHLAGRDAADPADPALQTELVRLQQANPLWRGVFTADANGTLRLDTLRLGTLRQPPAVPAGADALAPSVDALARIAPSIQPSTPFVSPLLDDGAGGRVTAIAVPIRRNDPTVRGFIGAWIDAKAWQRRLDASPPPADGHKSLVDPDHRLIARSPDPAAAAGQRLPTSDFGAAPSGRARSVSLEGREVLQAWHDVGSTGWRVGVGVDAAAVDARLRHAFVLAFSTAGGCLLLGVSLGLWLARELVQPIDELASGRPAVAVRPSRVLEIERLRERLLASQAQNDSAMAALQAKATEFQTLFDSSPVGLSATHDRECRSVVHNPAMAALFGPAPGAAAASVLHDGVPLTREQQPLHRAAASGERVAAMELQIDAGDGRPTVVLAHAVPLRDAQGRPRGAIGAAVDITRRKEDEQRLLDADAKLRENQNLIDLAQEAGHVGFFQYDFEHESLTWSPGQARLFGLQDGAATEPPRAGAANATPDEWLDRIDAGDRTHLHMLMRQMLVLGQERENFDYRIALGDTGSRWMSSRVLMHYRPDGTPQRLVAVTVDVSRHKMLELEREQLMAREQATRHEAEAVNHAKDDLLAMLGHELRNPLGAISSAVEVMQRVDRNGPVATNALQIMARQSDNLARILDDLLDAAGVISGRVVLARQPLDLAALCKRVLATLRLTGHERGEPGGNDIVADLTPVWIDADSTRIEQIVMNLLGNAVKHTKRGSRIELGVAHDASAAGERREGTPGDAVLQVRDHGAGIPPELLKRMFELFTQGERPLDRRGGGLGIGLTLVRRLATLHGGTVTARSSEDGSVFEVRLPAVPAPPGPVAAVERAGRFASQAGRAAAPRRVVLVEDNPDAAEALRTSLELDGHSVHSAADGVSGLAAIVAERPDVAIVDLGLPGITGFDVALRSRAAGYPGLLIATSGYGQEADTQRTRRAGFDAHLVKPVDAARLRELLLDRG